MHHSPLRVIAGAATAAMLLALLTACGGSSGRVTLTWYTNPDPGGQAAVAKACSTSKVLIKNQVLPQDAGQQRIQLARRLAAHDSGIDLMSLDPVFNAEFANAGFLAKIPGAHAVADQLAAGVGESGCTVHLVDEGVDTGPILLQERVPVLDGDTEETLHERIKAVEHRLLPQAVEELLCAR